MKKKYLIFGATGAIGSALAKQMYENNLDCHLIGRNEDELKKISNKLNYTYSLCDVLKLNFVNSLKEDLNEVEILGMSYCVGSIDIKPFRLTKPNDFVSSFVLNLVSITEIIKAFQDSLSENVIRDIRDYGLKTINTVKRYRT